MNILMLILGSLSLPSTFDLQYGGQDVKGSLPVGSTDFNPAGSSLKNIEQALMSTGTGSVTELGMPGTGSISIYFDSIINHYCIFSYYMF